ncbi:SDR family NAD(P)-dependent oxidoreductase [Spiractinospora alimapuensis]|uniref:SDR family NAD(P)-dependent oxidoreductase n=1 Tax=Spiractinospora alimapuensis TaxID=2820884 RepID=UPI001F25475A|nr:SDR family NAD(P)-dependent oxidoreductase [Spiractinospora alimapuensis]QVQ54157.1 SDR family NAD(P)-dependent oxidoreductase [Spiractinospora alimapuensis]
MDVADKVAVVAGGASGLGRAVCADLAKHGAAVAVLDRDGNGAREVADALPRAIAVEIDVTDAESVETAIAEAVDAFGAVHVNVNTAGVSSGAKLVSRGEPASLEDFRRVVDINLCGTFNVMRVAAAAMLRNEPDGGGERGVVINTASGAAFEGQIGQAAYSASKAGLVGLALPVAREFAGKGVRVNTIAPGLFDTPMAAGLPEAVRAGLVSMVTEPQRLGEPDEFARLVRSMVENAYINAECVRLDAATRMSAR